MRTLSRSRILSASHKLYQVLLFAYPAKHRREYGPLMAQLFRDLCRDTYRRSGLLGLAGIWIRTLWDLINTAAIEQVNALTKGSVLGIQNHSLIPTSWPKVGLTVLPGLFIIGNRSGFFVSAFGRRVGQVLEPGCLLALCTLLVIVGLVFERKLAVWSFPALGILLLSIWWLILPVAGLVIYRLHKQKYVHIPRPGKMLLYLLGLVFAADFFLLVLGDHNSNKLAAIVAVLPPLVLWTSLLLLPTAIGLPLARREGPLAGLFIVAAAFIPFSELLDPSYALGMWTSNHALVTAAEIIPAIGFLVAAPIWVMRSRTTHGQIWGLLLPVLVALVGAEAISGTIRPYYTDIWLIRVTGIAQFSAMLVLSAVLYATNRRDKMPTPTRGQKAWAR